MKATTQARRGVLLIVIMGLLAMFGLVAIAFVMVAGQHSRAAKSHAKTDMEMHSPRQELHQAAMQLAVGTNNALSSIGPRSIFEDLYGTDSVWNQSLSGFNTLAGGQLFEFDAPAGMTNPYIYLGRVLTMLSGPSGGKSTHIVGVNTAGTKLHATAFESGWPKNGDYYMINGAPFSGTGAGYNTATGKLDLKWGSGNWEVALLPNIVKASSYTGVVNPAQGGLNKDYTAADYQTPFLGTPPIPSASSPLGYRIIPSYHRPDLIAYWMNRIGGATDGPTFLKSGDPALIRAILFRPNPQDHPQFPGNSTIAGVPQFDPINGPWDVDNDGDGIPDSVWIDLGMPVRSTPDGRQYKPMYAIYCVDLDGRLNLNAHGAWAQTFDAYYQQTQLANELPNPLSNTARFADNGAGVATAALPRGQGMGPADVNLRPLFQGVTGMQPLAMYQMILGGDKTQLDGRYGDFQLASAGQMPRPGFAANDSRLDNSVFNPLHYNRWAEYTGNYWGFVTSTTFQLDSYATPPDLVAAGAVGLDLGGRPLWASMGRDTQLPDVPYKINLSPKAPHGATTPANQYVPDNPFSPAEMERMLRPFDRDNATLPGRLAGLSWANNAPWLMQQRHMLTTESWGLTCPSLSMPGALRTALGGAPRHVTDLLKAKGVPQDKWRQLLPPEILRGERLDLNRPFGNSYDDNSNGVVDEPQEAQNNEQLALYRTKDVPVTVAFDHINKLASEDANNFPGKDPTTGKEYTVRELQARYLYVLAFLLCDMDYMQTVFDDGGGNGLKLACRHLAQWAVNVVDFRDRDSIMTRFAFDTNLADGWNPPSDASFVVWGCERPELLLTEAKAWHDTRAKDTAEEQPSGKTTTQDNGPSNPKGETDGNNDFDQKKKPLPSLFFEIYNPWSGMEQQTGEMHMKQDGTKAWPGGVVLNQRTPNENHPVWRVVVTSAGDETQEQPDLDNYDATKRPDKIYSSIYFVDITQATGFSDPNATQDYYQQFYPDSSYAGKIAPIKPGRYMVVGPDSADEDYKTRPEQPTWLGELKSMTNWTTDRDSIRQIILKPDANPDTTGQVQVRNNPLGGSNDQPPTTQTLQNAAAAVINKSQPQDRRMGLTSPTRKAYPNQDAGASPSTHTEKDGYKVPYDEPFDYTTPASNAYHREEVATVLSQYGTQAHFRVLHLQRLANPLLPFDATTNPYRTIDSLPVDLTVFNGIKKPTDPDTGKEVVEPGVTNGNTQFTSRQRGEKNDTAQQFNLWKQEPVYKLIQSGQKVTTNPEHVFEYEFVHTFGYLNKGRDANSIFGDPVTNGGQSGAYGGDPQQPFPWLTWNNRPFASPMELLLVPTVHSSKLLARRKEGQNPSPDTAYYGFVHTGDTPEPYDADAKTTPDKQQFPHLLNFFSSKASVATGSSSSMQLHRLLEYVTVPSRYTGVTVQGSPQAFVGGDHWFHPPFNNIPTYREPGRINLNTIYYPEVFQGLINEIPTITPWNTFGNRDAATMWQRFNKSRRNDTEGIDLLRPNVNAPSVFGRPFRSFAGGEMVPLDAMKPAREIDATILRSDPDEKTPVKPLFERVSTQPYDNTNRNPYFRYEGLNKLANSVTTRSNVFAVWITVGYFEVYPHAVDAGHPDGYELRGELGSDTGEINRHRAFYIFDRSIPVGFQRGLDVNVENAILVRRYIE